MLAASELSFGQRLQPVAVQSLSPKALSPDSVGGEGWVRGRRLNLSSANFRRLLRNRACASALTLPPRRVQRNRLPHQRLERGGIERIAFVQIDRAARVAVEARIEQAFRIGQ